MIANGGEETLLTQLARDGFARLCLDPESARSARTVLAAAADFFALPIAEKQSIAIERSPHFRGYSEMHNARDWREQVHVGAEQSPSPSLANFAQLVGPNLWPSGTRFRDAVLSYMAMVAALGRTLWQALGRSWGLTLDEPDPYPLLKLIHYHPQPERAAVRSGVAAHVDFSLLTLTLADTVGGLELRAPTGEWVGVVPEPDTLLVHVGEILEFVSRGQLAATPHRVINRATDRGRLSLPFFFNPQLARTITPLSLPVAPRASEGEHVHRVLTREDADPFLFGDAEWRRKGENVWCATCVTR